jgi:tRNA1(Val) A37 N6-methylase TrmN6
MSELTCDEIAGLGVSLWQPRAGHRVGADAVLLAASAGAPVEAIVDVGAGVGAVGLALTRRFPQSRAILIEIAPELADLARRNAAEAGLAERVTITHVNLLDRAAMRAAGIEQGNADLVVTNPPYYNPGEVRASPDKARSLAHVLGSEGDALGRWIVASLALLRPGGRFVVIHRPERLADLLAAFGERLGAVAVRPVFPREGADAIRVLVSGVKGSRAPLRIRPGLVLHGDGGGFAPLAAAIHRGEAFLD